MLRSVIREHKDNFPVIFIKVCECMEAVSGIEVKEVDPTSHSYDLSNHSTQLWQEAEDDHRCLRPVSWYFSWVWPSWSELCPKEKIWEVLNMMGLYAGQKDSIYGESSKLINNDLMKEQYLDYQQLSCGQWSCPILDFFGVQGPMSNPRWKSWNFFLPKSDGWDWLHFLLILV